MKRLLTFLLVAALIITTPCVFATETGLSLKEGSSGDAVAHLQQRLIDLGFLLMPSPDGSYGDMTKYAVKAFEDELAVQGFEVVADGVADEMTMSYIDDTGLYIEAPLPVYGSKGGIVAQLQKILIGLDILDGSADGAYGGMTKTAVTVFQQAMFDAGIEGAQVTGDVDLPTLDAVIYLPKGVKARLPGGYSPDDPLVISTSNLYAKSSILMDADTGEILFEKDADAKRYPASTTKIMTLLLAVENGKLNKKVTIPKAAADVPGDSSLVPVTVGEVMTFEDLLYGMMINSGNDAANSVAALVGGNVQNFVDLMNAKASQLGMTGTHYANPHGYHSESHYTTARDMATLTVQALKNGTFKNIVSTKNYIMAATKKRKELSLHCAYDILNPNSSSFYPFAYGIKTGYTSYAGQCYVGAAEKNGRTLVAVVFHASYRRVHLWDDAAVLFSYGFAALGQ